MKDKIAGRLLIISFMAAFTAAFAGKVEWFIYSLALAAVLTGCGLIKENTVAGGAFLITDAWQVLIHILLPSKQHYYSWHYNSIFSSGNCNSHLPVYKFVFFMVRFHKKT